MAEYVELLVKAVDATHPDKVKNLRGCYKRGDVVDIKPEGFQWGSEEGPPKFQIVMMLKSEADKLALLEPEKVVAIADVAKGELEPQMVRRRKIGVNLDALAATKPAEKIELTADRISALVITKPRAKDELAGLMKVTK